MSDLYKIEGFKEDKFVIIIQVIGPLVFMGLLSELRILNYERSEKTRTINCI